MLSQGVQKFIVSTQKQTVQTRSVRVWIHLPLLDRIQETQEARKRIPTVDVIFSVSGGIFPWAGVHAQHRWSSPMPSVSLPVFNQSNKQLMQRKQIRSSRLFTKHFVQEGDEVDALRMLVLE